MEQLKAENARLKNRAEQDKVVILKLRAEVEELKEVPLDHWLGRVPVDFGSDTAMWDSGVPSGHLHPPSDGSFQSYCPEDFEEGAILKEKEVLVVEDVGAAQGEAAATRGAYREVLPGEPMEGEELDQDQAKKVDMAKELLKPITNESSAV